MPDSKGKTLAFGRDAEPLSEKPSRSLSGPRGGGWCGSGGRRRPSSTALPRREERDRFGDERMRDLRDRAAGDLVGGEEGPVQEGGVHGPEMSSIRRSHFSHLSMSGSQRSFRDRPGDDVGHGVGVFVAVRDPERGRAQGFGQREFLVRFDLVDRDVLATRRAGSRGGSRAGSGPSRPCSRPASLCVFATSRPSCARPR